LERRRTRCDVDEKALTTLDAYDRENVIKSLASRAALFAKLRAAVADGPIVVYGVWWNEEMRVDERRAMTIAEMENALEAFPERVVLDVAS
jgi:hypothetical protein